MNEHWISRRDIIAKAQHDLIREMYLRAQPSVDIDDYDFNALTKEEKEHFQEWYYLPIEIQNQLVDDYLEAYAAEDPMKMWFNWLIERFKEGGHRTVYKEIFKPGEKVRTGEETEKLDELIGAENAEKVYKLMQDFMGFYRTNMDEHTIRGAVMFGPTPTADTVEAHWGIKVNDDVYKGYDGKMWDYTYQDYINGKITFQPDEED